VQKRRSKETVIVITSIILSKFLKSEQIIPAYIWKVNPPFLCIYIIIFRLSNTGSGGRTLRSGFCSRKWQNISFYSTASDRPWPTPFQRHIKCVTPIPSLRVKFNTKLHRKRIQGKWSLIFIPSYVFTTLRLIN
jgi:hypothetical protein